MIYFDSAATSFQKPASVAAAMWEALASMSSPGRGGYPAAARAADTAFQCRTELADMFGLENPEQVVFTLNATHALNIAIKSLVPPGGKATVRSRPAPVPGSAGVGSASCRASEGRVPRELSHAWALWSPRLRGDLAEHLPGPPGPSACDLPRRRWSVERVGGVAVGCLGLKAPA